MSSYRCPNCKNRVVQKSGDETHVRADGKITIDGHGICHAQCFFCKAVIELPLELSKSVQDERFTVDVTRVSRPRS